MTSSRNVVSMGARTVNVQARWQPRCGKATDMDGSGRRVNARCGNAAMWMPADVARVFLLRGFRVRPPGGPPHSRWSEACEPP